MLKSQEIKIFRVIIIIIKKDWEYTAQISETVLTIQFGMLGLIERK